MVSRGTSGRRGTHKHVERVEILEARDHVGYEGVPRDGGQHVALVPNVLHLSEPDDCRALATGSPKASDVPSTLRRTLSAYTLSSSPSGGHASLTSQTRANVPVEP
jgi:hypothetical protein